MISEDSPLPHIPGLVKDQFFKRQVTVYQKKKGYRFSIDAPLLADFLPYMPEDKALEIGTGSGIISLLVLFHEKFRKVDAIEIQKDFYEISTLNSRKNELEESFTIHHGDFCDVWKNYKGYKYIYSNPPFMPVADGRMSPNEEIAIAKNEVKIDLGRIVFNTRKMLADKGSLFLVLPWQRYDELIQLSEKAGFFVKRLRKVLNEPDSGEPVRFLIQLSTYRDSFLEEEPLVIYKTKGTYSEEAEQIFTGIKR